MIDDPLSHLALEQRSVRRARNGLGRVGGEVNELDELESLGVRETRVAGVFDRAEVNGVIGSRFGVT